MECLEDRSDVVVFWGFSNSTGESILSSLEAVYLGDVYVPEERIATKTPFNSTQLLTPMMINCPKSHYTHTYLLMALETISVSIRLIDM